MAKTGSRLTVRLGVIPEDPSAASTTGRHLEAAACAVFPTWSMWKTSNGRVSEFNGGMSPFAARETASADTHSGRSAAMLAPFGGSSR